MTRWLALSLLGVATLAAPHAGAYCQARTCDPATSEESCEADSSGCVLEGLPLHWASDCVTFAIQRDGSERLGLGASEVDDVVERAFGTWLAADCDGEGPSLRVGYMGPVVCANSEYNQNGRNANVVIFRDAAWPYPAGLDTYGFSRVRFDTKTGEIWDVDIELNSAEFDLTLDGEDGPDLQSILTHEIGHFLGLGHAASEDADASMRANWNGKGTSLRSLDADDVRGICAMYPPERKPASTSCEPRHGFASECKVPLDAAPGESGCALDNRRHQPAFGFALLAVLGCALRARRAALRSGR